MALYIQKNKKKENIFTRLFKNFYDDDIFYAGGETTAPAAPAPSGSFTCELVPPHWPCDIPEAKTLRLTLIIYMILHVGFAVAHVLVILNLMFALKEMLPLYICFYGYRTLHRFVLYFYCVMIAASGVLGVFSFFSMGSFTFFSILLYVGELVLYVLMGYRLFFLIGDYGTGLAS